MSNYSRIRFDAEKAANSSYAFSKHHLVSAAKTYDEACFEDEVDALAAGTTFSLANFTTVYGVLVENLGTTAATFVTVVLKNAAAATPAVKIPIAAEGYQFFFTPDCDPSVNMTLTASAGTIACKVTVFGT